MPGPGAVTIRADVPYGSYGGDVHLRGAFSSHIVLEASSESSTSTRQAAAGSTAVTRTPGPVP
jgi:hypothetical protein